MHFINENIVKLTKRIHSLVIKRANADNEITIFLCGAGDGPYKIVRDKIGYHLCEDKSKYRYSVHYPEDLFFDLIRGHERHNLLDLENMLAENVTSTVILLQSPGSFTELGAFANHPVLSQKLVVVMDSKYKNHKSFINLGPIQYLQQHTNSSVIYNNFVNLDELSKEIRSEVRTKKSSIKIEMTLANPLYSYQFVYLLIYTLGPIPKDILIKLIRISENSQQLDKVLIFAGCAITGLINKGIVTSTNGNLATRPDDFASDGFEMLRHFRNNIGINKIRTNALNYTLRKDRGWRV